MIGKDRDPSIGKQTQFNRGVSGNPKGRPKSYQILFNECINDDERRAMIEVLKVKALKGDLKALGMIMDRVDGRPRQMVELKDERQPSVILVKDQATKDALEQICS